MMRKSLLFIGLVVAGNPVTAQDCGAIEVASWLLGHWETERGATESWRQASDDTFEGHGFDGRNHESLRMVEMAGEVFYIAKVAHNEMPIPFKLTACTGDSLVFENPDHDFPRRLEYRHQGDTLQVIVSDGGERGFQLMFHRQGGQ